jgi:hypothetical protein
VLYSSPVQTHSIQFSARHEIEKVLSSFASASSTFVRVSFIVAKAGKLINFFARNETLKAFFFLKVH